MNGYRGEHIIFESFNSIHSQHGSRVALTHANVRAADKEGDANVNETDYVLRRHMNGE